MPRSRPHCCQGLKDHGVREIFGIPGDFVLPFFRVIEDSGATGRRPLVLVGDGAFSDDRLGARQLPALRLRSRRRAVQQCELGNAVCILARIPLQRPRRLEFAALAPSLGGYGERVSTRRELKAALDRAMGRRGRFSLVEVTLPAARPRARSPASWRASRRQVSRNAPP
jgi:indolepyruvate decarboxylase